MAIGSGRGRGSGVARALLVLLVLWLPSLPPTDVVPGGGGVLACASPPAPLAQAPSCKDTVPGARPAATVGDPGAPSAPAHGTGFAWTAPRAADAALPAIRIAFPGTPGRPNLSRAPPRA
jgi:hypothetical protein